MKPNPPPGTHIVHQATCEPPLISVVLPTYNRAAMLPESVESVLSQTERSLELIIVDDGSSDSTPILAKDYATRDNRVTYLRQQNQRLPRALNNGFAVARGRFFTWTSDDNRYRPEALATMGRYLQDHDDVGLVYAEMCWLTPQGPLYRPFPHPGRYWHENTFGGAFLYRRTVAEAVGGYAPDLEMVEDYDFFLRLTYHAKVHHLAETLYEFRLHGESLTSVRNEDQIRALEKMLLRHIEYSRAKPSQLSQLAATLARIYRNSGRTHDSMRLARLAWRLWPLGLRANRALVLSLAKRLFPNRPSNKGKPI